MQIVLNQLTTTADMDLYLGPAATKETPASGNLEAIFAERKGGSPTDDIGDSLLTMSDY